MRHQPWGTPFMYDSRAALGPLHLGLTAPYLCSQHQAFSNEERNDSSVALPDEDRRGFRSKLLETQKFVAIPGVTLSRDYVRSPWHHALEVRAERQRLPGWPTTMLLCRSGCLIFMRTWAKQCRFVNGTFKTFGFPKIGLSRTNGTERPDFGRL